MKRHPLSRLAVLAVALAATASAWVVGTAANATLGTLPVALAQNAPGDAQNAEGGPPRRGGMRRFGAVLQSLDLSDSQKSRIRTIMQNARQKNQNADPATRRATMREAFAQIDKVLTPSQRTQLHAKLQAMRQQRHEEQPRSSQ